MRRSIAWVLGVLVLTVGLSGCRGGSSTATGSITGKVVDPDGQPVSGIIMQVGDRTATTDANGEFALSEVAPGLWRLIGAGGDQAHYVVTATEVSVDKSQTVDTVSITAYRMQGAGVIVQGSYSNYGIPRTFVKRSSFKEQLVLSRWQPSLKSGTVKALHWARAASTGMIKDNVTYFYLTWDPVNINGVDATKYVIKYKGQDRSLDTIVWDSEAASDPNASGYDPTDPTFSLATPKAYLDLPFELSNNGISITDAGIYRFQIVAMDSSGNELDLPELSVSLGQMLEAFPSALSESGSELRWNGVTGAAGYRVLVAADKEMDDIVWNSDDNNPLSAVADSVTLQGLITGVEYFWNVSAYAADVTGWTAEVTTSDVKAFTAP